MSETKGDPPISPASSTTGPSVKAEIPPMGKPVRGRGRFFAAFVTIGIVVLLIGAIALTLPELRLLGQSPATAKAPASLADLDRAVTALDARMAGLEKSAAATQPASAALSEVAARLDAIEPRLAALEAEMTRAADRDALAGLQDRVTRLERENASAMLTRAAATLALANLAHAAESGMPFTPEWEALSALAPGDPALPALQPLAASGVPSLAALAARFPGAARASLDAERVDAADGNFFARLWAGLTRLVSVRRVVTVEGNTTQDRLARAQADLDNGDSAGAVMEVQGVTGAAATSIAPWLMDAQARLAADRAVAEMNARIVAALAAPSPQAPTQNARPAGP